MASFTPQEIEQFLQEFFDVVGARQYVGARYVPIFGRAGEDTIEWDDHAPYEPLTVVMHGGVSYVSRRYVPKDVQITDTAYWVETYRFNAQVEQYRQEVLTFQGQIDDIRRDMESDYVPFPDSLVLPKYGTLGQVLTTLADGETKWEDPVVPSDAQAEEVITAWLDDHPEATTTVQDGAISTAKLANGAVTDPKLYDYGIKPIAQTGLRNVHRIASNSYYLLDSNDFIQGAIDINGNLSGAGADRVIITPALIPIELPSIITILPAAPFADVAVHRYDKYGNYLVTESYSSQKQAMAIVGPDTRYVRIACRQASGVADPTDYASYICICNVNYRKETVNKTITVDTGDIVSGFQVAARPYELVNTTQNNFANLTSRFYYHSDTYIKVSFTVGSTVNNCTVKSIKEGTTKTKVISANKTLIIEPHSDTFFTFKNTGLTQLDPRDYDFNITLEPIENHDFIVPTEHGGHSLTNVYANISTTTSYIRDAKTLYPGDAKYIVYYDNGNSVTLTCRFRASDNTSILEDSLRLYDGEPREIPNGCEYITFEAQNANTYDLDIRLFGGGNCHLGKRCFRNNGNEVVCSFNIPNNQLLTTNLTYMLPPNYTEGGKPLPMIVWFDGSANYPTIDSGFSSVKLPGLTYLRDEGYVVMQVFAWGWEYSQTCPGCGSDMPYPTRTCLTLIKGAIEYMCDRYNVDPNNVHVMSKSFGGIIASYFTTSPVWPFKSIGMFSPCIDVLSMRGRFKGGRMALVADLDFEGDYVQDFLDINTDGSTETGVPNYYFSPRCQNVWLDNFQKLIEINPAWKYLLGNTIDNTYTRSLSDAQAWWNNGQLDPTLYDDDTLSKISSVPCKLWIGTNDTDTPYQIMGTFVKQVNNAGGYATSTVINNGGHSSPDFGNTEPVTTKLGIYHEAVAIGWRENMEWIRLNSDIEV